MRYSRASATSIDLFVSEIAAFSEFSSEVVAEAVADPLPAAALHRLPRFGFANAWRRARWIARLAAERRPAAVVMQQHALSAARLARLAPWMPVVLQRHNFVKGDAAPGALAATRRRWRANRFRGLAGITFVSATAQAQFEADYPDVEAPRAVIPNGIATARWRPAREREKLVLVVGRATPEKGLIEGIDALLTALEGRPDWRGAFVVSESARNPAYFSALQTKANSSRGRVEILTDLPFPAVKALNERAAIALIPSRWREPFGRTCLEAHAGGAAVISSGTGGLREVSGEAAVYASPDDPAEFAQAIACLMDDEPRRNALAADGRERVKSLFDLSVVAANFDHFLHQITL